jgi:threonine dehydratase
MSDLKRAHVFVGIQILERQEANEIAAVFARDGLDAINLTDDEMAKLHIRHLVGGSSWHAKDERLFRFEFPERPGALSRFLSQMRPDWNISLFHYRNHGADFGRVLVGLQVPQTDEAAFQHFLEGLGYPHLEETDNPAYHLFLRPQGH